MLLKLFIIGILAVIAIFLGGHAVAWRRACVTIAHTIQVVNWSYNGRGIDCPTVRELSQGDIIRFTPRWVSACHLLALGFLLLTIVLSFLMFAWHVALIVGLITYALMELTGFACPARNHPYYVIRVYHSFCQSLAIAERYNLEPMGSDLRQRIIEIKRAYPDLIGEATEKQQTSEPDDSGSSIGALGSG